MPAKTRIPLLLGGAAAILFIAPDARAQSVSATLVGTVLDSSNAATPNARISVTNKGTNITRTALSNERGDYIIANLAPGVYRLSAEHEGFRRTVVDEMELFVNQTARFDVVLQVGTLAEVVEVTGQAPLVASETSSGRPGD